MRKVCANILLVILIFVLCIQTKADYDPRYDLGVTGYLLGIDSTAGAVYCNDWNRTFCPSTGTYGTLVGYDVYGNIIVAPDLYSIASILGQNYYCLAYTDDRGNCYANSLGSTFTPSTNEMGYLAGYNEQRVPIIQVTQVIYEITSHFITYSFAPIASSSVGNGNTVNNLPVPATPQRTNSQSSSNLGLQPITSSTEVRDIIDGYEIAVTALGLALANLSSDDFDEATFWVAIGLSESMYEEYDEAFNNIDFNSLSNEDKTYYANMMARISAYIPLIIAYFG